MKSTISSEIWGSRYFVNRAVRSYAFAGACVAVLLGAAGVGASLGVLIQICVLLRARVHEHSVRRSLAFSQIFLVS